MSVRTTLLAAATAVMLTGCIARTAVDVVTAPVRAAGQVVDWTTTSQDESDRALGRAVRAREEEIGRLERRRQRAAQDCNEGDRSACREAETLADDIAELRARPYDAPDDD